MGTVRHSQQCVEVLFAEAWDNPPREWNEPGASPLALSQSAVHAPARRYERFANGGVSSLADAIDADDPELTVKSAVGFPTEGNFRIIIDSEIMLVYRVAGKVFRVFRGQEGTTAATHDGDAAIYHVVTAGALAGRDADQFVSQTIGNRDAAGQAGRLYLPTEGFASQDDGTAWSMMPYWRFTPPVIDDFTWVNQGGATVADYQGMMVLVPPAASGDNLRLLVKTAPATPYRIAVAMVAQDPDVTSGYAGQYGICWRDSGSGKIITFGIGRYTETWPIQQWAHTQWSSPTTIAGSGQISRRRVAPQWPYWVRFGDDGTNRTVEVSGDGVTWQLYEALESRSTFFTADQVGVYANQSLSSKTPRRVVSFLHWSESK